MYPVHMMGILLPSETAFYVFSQRIYVLKFLRHAAVTVLSPQHTTYYIMQIFGSYNIHILQKW